MANIVIASDDQLCQSAMNWFVKHQKCVNDTAKIDTLKDGEKFYIIAHDIELGDASQLIEYMSQFDFPMEADFMIVLIVCSAHTLNFTQGLVTPAEAIANHFQRNVYASKTLVYGRWSDDGAASFTGDYLTVTPNTDIESLFEKLKI